MGASANVLKYAQGEKSAYLVGVHFFIGPESSDRFVSRNVAVDKFLCFGYISRTDSNNLVYDIMGITTEPSALEVNS